VDPACCIESAACPCASEWALSHAGSIAMVDMLLSAGADVDALTNDHWTPLHESALNGHVVAVERLLRAGAQVCMYPGLWRP